MTMEQLEARLAALELQVTRLQAVVDASEAKKEPSWKAEAGRFANDPLFEEMVRIVQKRREREHPDRSKKNGAKVKAKAKKAKHAGAGH